jgi:NAD(P)-dependent dehydrogenase (short-subunit alcohol dehydrogenase family)
LRAVFELNVYGAFWACRAAIRRMSTRNGGQGGSIVLVSSIGGRHGSPGVFVWYAASKAAMNSMTTGLSLELAQDGIRVNAVSPGAIDTAIHPPAQIERLRAATPMGRVGTPEEAAEAILFLLSDKASFITGANLTVSGGR